MTEGGLLLASPTGVEWVLIVIVGSILAWALHVSHRSATSKTEAFQSACRQLGLVRRSPTRATSDGFEISWGHETGYDTSTSPTVTLAWWVAVMPPHDAPPTIRLRAPSSRAEGETTGDSAFDDVVWLSGDRRLILAALDHQTRHLIQAASSLGTFEIRPDGEVRLTHRGGEISEGTVLRMTRMAVEGAKCLHVDRRSLPLLLKRRATEDPDASVRRNAFGVLKAFYPEHEQSQAAASAGVTDADPSVRVLAAMLARPHDTGALLQSALDDATPASFRAEAISALDTVEEPLRSDVVLGCTRAGTPPDVAAAAINLASRTGMWGQRDDVRPWARHRAENARASVVDYARAGLEQGVDLLDLLHDVLDGRGDSAEREALDALGQHGSGASLRLLATYEPPPPLRQAREEAVERMRNRLEPARGTLALSGSPASGQLTTTTQSEGSLSDPEPEPA